MVRKKSFSTTFFSVGSFLPLSRNLCYHLRQSSETSCLKLCTQSCREAAIIWDFELFFTFVDSLTLARVAAARKDPLQRKGTT